MRTMALLAFNREKEYLNIGNNSYKVKTVSKTPAIIAKNFFKLNL